MLPDLPNLPLRKSRVNDYCPSIEPADGEQEHNSRNTIFTDDHYPVAAAHSQLA
jgi:hypothetical protein